MANPHNATEIRDEILEIAETIGEGIVLAELVRRMGIDDLREELEYLTEAYRPYYQD